MLEKGRSIWYIQSLLAVGVAQLVEHRVVAPVVVGSSPITHPIKKASARSSAG